MPSWRDGLVSDWTVKLGEKTFFLHRWQLLQRSGFFAAQFNESYGANGTDLTHLLPTATWGAFETCLDYMYGELPGTEDLAPEMTLPLLKISDCLDIGALFSDRMKAGEDLVRSNPIALLKGVAGVVEAEGDPLMRLVERALGSVRLDFENQASEACDRVQELPPIVVRQLLASDVLDVSREDVVLNFLLRYVAAWEAETAEQGQLWQLLRVPFLSAESLLTLHHLGLEERAGLPLQQGLLLRLALQEARDPAMAARLCAGGPAVLSTWCAPRALALQPVAVRKSRRGNPAYTALLGRRPLPWIEGVGRAFEVRLDRAPRPPEQVWSSQQGGAAGSAASCNSSTCLADNQSEPDEWYVGKILVGVCLDSPAAIERLPDWESVDYFAINRCGELIVKSCLVGVAARDPGATCKGFYFRGVDPYDHDEDGPDHNLEVGDTVRVCVSEEGTLLVSVNGVLTVSAPLSAARCLCPECTAGLQSLVNDGALPSAWRKGKGKGGGSKGGGIVCKGKGRGRGKSGDGLLGSNMYAMVGLPDPSAVTLLPVPHRSALSPASCC